MDEDEKCQNLIIYWLSQKNSEDLWPPEGTISLHTAKKEHNWSVN